ncbi:hypothetical protein ACQUJZ_20515, partial [Ralstonia pseudosolanacearum]
QRLQCLPQFIADLLSCHANNNAQPPAFDDLVLLATLSQFMCGFKYTGAIVPSRETARSLIRSLVGNDGLAGLRSKPQQGWPNLLKPCSAQATGRLRLTLARHH